MSWFTAAAASDELVRSALGFIELGMEPTAAIREVRVVRPGAIETREQEGYEKDTCWVSTWA
jgi:hypothetical protein